MRDTVLGYGWHFSHRASSNSTRRPQLFDWTDDPRKATTDVAVYMGTAISDGIDAPGRKIAWVLESPAISEWQGTTPFIGAHLDRVLESYEFVLTSDRSFCARHPRIVYHPAAANLPWVPEESYGLYKKDRLCSMFASDKAMVEGHERRKRVAARLRDKLDLFGGACGSPRIGGGGAHPDKRAGLLPYMFQVVMENAKVDFYYTEKITDCFATGTVPIYWGSDCIGELFDTDGIIVLDDDDFDVDALSADRYYAMLPAVRNNLRRVRELESTDDLLYRRYVRSPRHVLVPGPAGDTSEPPHVGPLPEHADGAATVPWAPWDPQRVLATPARGPMAADARLDFVRAAEQATITLAADVPPAQLTTRAVRTWMHAPRTADAAGAVATGFPQLSRAFLLHLRDAFIGDNVVFDSERYYAMGRWWLGMSGHVYAETREVRHVEAAASVAAWGGEAFQHFVVDALPTLASLIDLLETPELGHVRIVSHDEPETPARWFWTRLGLADRIAAKPRNADAGFVVHADLVLYPQFEPNLNELGLYPRGCLRPLQQRLGTLDAERRDCVVYLQRVHTRSVANERELLAAVRHALVGTGLELAVFPGATDPGAAEDLMRRARIVFGPHGGAFANLVFAPPGTHVIEFLPWPRLLREKEEGRPASHGRPFMYYGLAQAAGHHYWMVEPAQFGHDAPGMEVPTEQVATIVHEIVAGETSRQAVSPRRRIVLPALR